MRAFKNSLLVLVLSLCLFVTGGGYASAFSIYGNICKADGADQSATCSTTSGRNGQNPLTGNHGLLSNIANIVAFVAGAAAVIVILVGAIRIISANGNADAVSSGRRMVVAALIGLVIIALSRTIIYFVLSRIYS